ncbi:MAG: hypothetical protein JWN54_4024, partial [Mycobacterium sp.]|nr:hypothetical protein [Mycobacterium sp.]
PGYRMAENSSCERFTALVCMSEIVN